jgi:uncharacterized Fe-S cluster-containing MiaB family protein
VDEQAKLRKHIELFEAQENLVRMENARRDCIEVWNRDIRAARKIIDRIRNEIRTGDVQPELFDLIKKK